LILKARSAVTEASSSSPECVKTSKSRVTGVNEFLTRRYFAAGYVSPEIPDVPTREQHFISMDYSSQDGFLTSFCVGVHTIQV
jgi:hypothetical protein